MPLDHHLNQEGKEEMSESTPKMIDSLRKEAVTLGEALCITAIYLGIGTAIYRGCTNKYPWEEKSDRVEVLDKYEPVNILEIPLQ